MGLEVSLSFLDEEVKIQCLVGRLVPQSQYLFKKLDIPFCSEIISKKLLSVRKWYLFDNKIDTKKAHCVQKLPKMIHKNVNAFDGLMLHFQSVKDTFLKFIELFFFKTSCSIATRDIIILIETEPFWI